MWIGKPGDPSIIVPLLIAYAIATIGVEFATVFNNAMMPTLVRPSASGGCPAPDGPPVMLAEF
jgi:UMF1 family MFS transporter